MEKERINKTSDQAETKTAIAVGRRDVLQTTFEWPERNLTMLYSATLASSRDRGKVFMGHDASMEVSDVLTLTADRDSERYAEKIKQGVIPTDKPFFTYVPGQRQGGDSKRIVKRVRKLNYIFYL